MSVITDTYTIGRFTDDFVAEWNGRILNVNGANVNYDGRYGIQCMDLWNYFWDELGLTGIQPHADAASVWEDSQGKHYEYFDGILPNQPAKKGDVFIYNRQAWGTGYGHIGIVISDNGDGTITVLETNGLGDGYEDETGQHGSPARIHTWPKTNLYGYLRLIKDDFLSKLNDKQQEELYEWVKYLYNEFQPINTGSKTNPTKVRIRDFIALGTRAAQKGRDILVKQFPDK